MPTRTSPTSVSGSPTSVADGARLELIDADLAAYDDVRRRVSSLARAHPDRLDLPVAACPGWTARDVVAHLAGLAEDLVEQRLDGYGSVAWTGAQVRRAGGRPIEGVLDDWAAATGRLSDVAPLAGVPAAAMAFGDAVVHEADLHGVLEPGSRVPIAAVMAGLRAGIGRWRPVLERAGAPTLRVIAEGQREFLLGRGDTAAATVRADPYDLFRVVFGRRSASQARALDWSGDPEPYIEAGLPFPFSWAEADVRD